MSNQKLQILPLVSSKSLEPLTEQEMSLRGQGDVNIKAGGWLSDVDFSGSQVHAYDLPPDYYQKQLDILLAGIQTQVGGAA